MTRVEFLNREPARRIASQVNLFPAPLLIFEWPEAAFWRDELIAAIETRRAKSRGIKMTNVGGWHSETDFAGWEDKAVQSLVRWAAAMASQATSTWRRANDVSPPAIWRMNAWANINPPGGAHNRVHHHINRDWNWSASYYLKMPATAEGAAARGEIVFEDRFAGVDPARNAAEGRRTFSHMPAEGELVLFPSWLYHRVEPHDGEHDRISVAMNFHSPWLEGSRYWQHRKSALWRKAPWLMRPLAKLAGKWDQNDPNGPPGSDVTPDPAYL